RSRRCAADRRPTCPSVSPAENFWWGTASSDARRGPPGESCIAYDDCQPLCRKNQKLVLDSPCHRRAGGSAEQDCPRYGAAPLISVSIPLLLSFCVDGPCKEITPSRIRPVQCFVMIQASITSQLVLLSFKTGSLN